MNSSSLEKRQAKSKIEKNVRWQPPVDGCVKINMDGALKGNPGVASAADVIRDGGWLAGLISSSLGQMQQCFDCKTGVDACMGGRIS